MAVPLKRNAFAEKHPDLFPVFSERTENVVFSFFLHKTTKRYSFRKIFAVLSIILRLQKKGTEFLGNDHDDDSNGDDDDDDDDDDNDDNDDDDDDKDNNDIDDDADNDDNGDDDNNANGDDDSDDDD